MEALIKQLAEAWGPPGFEHHIRDMIRAEVEALADEVRVDALGNLICRIGDAGEDRKRVMLAAHMDEIGLIVSHIDRQGFARFASIGGLFPATLLGARVRFENGAIGTVGVDHQFTKRTNLPGLGGFYIDISERTNGTGPDTLAGVQVGDPGAFMGTVERRGSRLIGKSLDDRVGCAIQIEVMRRVKEAGTPNTCYFAFTVQEEVGTRGAGPAAFGVEPDLAIAVDVAASGDAPHSKKTGLTIGKGAAITARDTGLIVPMPVRKLITTRADEHHIPYQVDVAEAASTDGKVMQLARAGVPTGVISVPVRYVHTQSETVDYGDVEAVRDLLVALVSGEIAL